MKTLAVGIILLMVALLLMARHCNVKDGGDDDENP